MSAFRLAAGSVVLSAFVFACSGWDPSKPFEREAPQVNEAIVYYDGGEAGTASLILEDYLLTGHCGDDGNIGTPNRLNEKPNGTFDFGLALFKIGEMYGARFGDEEIDGGSKDPSFAKLRGSFVDCALRVVRRISEDATQPASLRARARYLEGNLLFSTAAYQEAVTAYDKALELAPGMSDGGPSGVPDGSAAKFTPDPVGRDAAWNRAIALRRIEDKKDAGNDASSEGGDGGGEGGGSDGGDGGGGDGGGGDGGKDGGNNDDPSKDGGGNNDDQPDASKDSGANPPPKPDPKDPPDAGPQNQPPPPSRQSQDERILDQLENAPTVQQEAARKQAGRRKVVHGIADK